MKNLFYVPRYRGHTIIHPVKAKYGAVTVYAYPLSSGRGGIRASRLMASICKLAGLENIGVKVMFIPHRAHFWKSRSPAIPCQAFICEQVEGCAEAGTNASSTHVLTASMHVL